MNTQTQSMKGARTFLLGMLAGASIVAGGLVLARGQNLISPPTVMIHTDSMGGAVAIPSVTPVSEELPPAIDLPRAVVIGHRLKSLVRSEPVSSVAGLDLSLDGAAVSYT